MNVQRQEKSQNQKLQSSGQNAVQCEEKLNKLAPDLQVLHDLRWKHPRSLLLGCLRINS